MKRIYIPVIKGVDGSEFMPETSFQWNTAADMIADIWSGQVEDVVRVMCLDFDNYRLEDVTEAIAKEIGELSFEKSEWPYPALRKWLDGWGVEYFLVEEDDDQAAFFNPRKEWGTLNRAQQI